MPDDNGNQAGGGGQYQPGPVQPNSPYAPGPIVSQYGNLALKPQPVYDRAELISSPGRNNAAGQQQNQYGNIGLRVRPGNAYEAADGPIASSVAVAAGNIAAGRPADSASGNYAPALSRNGSYAPAPNRNGIYQPAPNRNYAAAPANPQARNNWQPNPAPIGRQNALSPRQQAGPTTMDIAQILDPSIRSQGGAGGNNAGGNAAGQPRPGIGQGGQNLGAMAGFNRGGGQPYVVPLQRVLPPGQNIYPNVKKN